PPASVVWIAGGDAKGQSFDQLVKDVAATLRGVVLIGEDRSALRTALSKYAPKVPVVEVSSHEDMMFSVVNEAVALSLPGDKVILAPACASWDQFANYSQRGQAFAKAVARLEG
ncbi:MAG: UDP-N-acetylmuramoyl-L-alanine--D-glutamate ligase, partial [Varibaculum timonense]